MRVLTERFILENGEQYFKCSEVICSLEIWKFWEFGSKENGILILKFKLWQQG